MKKKLIFFVLIFLSGCVVAQTNWNKKAKEAAIETDKKIFKSDTLTFIIQSEKHIEEKLKHLNYQLDSIYLLIDRARLERSLRVNYKQLNK